MTKYFEDFPAGTVLDCGAFSFTEDQIVTFARAFDPQPFHIDAAAAHDTIYGGLIASGWHTASQAMRQVVDHALADAAAMGSPGLSELGWKKPVRPGDRLRVRLTVEEARKSASRPGLGITSQLIEVLNDADEIVLQWRAAVLFATRPESP
jgi:acyl dehydratase